MRNSRETVYVRVDDQKKRTEIGYWLCIHFVNWNRIILWATKNVRYSFLYAFALLEMLPVIECVEKLDFIGLVPTFNLVHSLEQNVS